MEASDDNIMLATHALLTTDTNPSIAAEKLFFKNEQMVLNILNPGKR